jgi:mannose-6-phosphate isomerase-like protein (cupin superfamily)
MRVGMVTKGRGECVTPHGTYELRPGMAFIIHEDGEHKFRTSSECMDVVAFHPNSDFGPTDEEHPMLNMTFVDGTSAKHLEEIKTK